MKTSILIPTLRFPPAGGVGLRRLVKLSREFYRMGYDVHIITTHNEAQVNNYGKDIEETDIKITKLPSLSLVNFFNNSHNSLIWKIIKKIIFYITWPLYWVDNALLWGLVLIPYMMWYIKKHNIKNVYCTGPPFSVLFHVAIVKFFFGKSFNYICEFRDVWTEDALSVLPPPKVLSRGVLRLMKRFAFDKCDQIVMVTKGCLLLEVPILYHNKSQVIENGYDEDEFPDEIKLVKIKNKVVYTGNIVDAEREEGLVLFLKALRKAVSIKPEVVFELCGQLSRRVEYTLNNDFADLVESGNVIYKGVISTQGANKLVNEAEYGLVLMQRSQASAIASKLYEYCAAGTKIIAIGPEGDLSEKMSQFNVGAFFYLDDVDVVSKVENYLLNDNEDIQYDFEEIRTQNSFKLIAEHMAKLFL